MPVEAALAEVVVLVEHADLLAGEVLLEVLAEDLALDRVVRLPAERVRLGRAVVPAGATGGDEDVGHLLGVQEPDDLGVGGRAEPFEDPEHLALEDQLVDDVDRVGRVVGVVLDDQVDLSSEHAAVRVHVVEERLRRRGDLVVARRGRSRQRLMGAERDAGCRDARCGGATVAAATTARHCCYCHRYSLLVLLLDEPQPAATSATAAMTPTHASDLVPRKLIPLLLHMVEPAGTARTSTRQM